MFPSYISQHYIGWETSQHSAKISLKRKLVPVLELFVVVGPTWRGEGGLRDRELC